MQSAWHIVGLHLTESKIEVMCLSYTNATKSKMVNAILFQLKQRYCHRGGLRKEYLFMLRVQIFSWLRGSDGRTMSTQGELYQVKCPGDVSGPQRLAMEPERLLCFSASARTWLGAVKPEPAGSELLLSGSNCPKYLSVTESSCQTNAYRLGLLQSTSQVEFCKQ